MILKEFTEGQRERKAYDREHSEDGSCRKPAEEMKVRNETTICNFS